MYISRGNLQFPKDFIRIPVRVIMSLNFVPLALLVLGVIGGSFADEPEHIVGGTDANIGEFPYQVSLTQYGQHFCGGSLISNRAIVTAAHCTVNMRAPYNGFAIVTGTITRSNSGQTHRVKHVINHPNYIERGVSIVINDISVIILAAPLQFNNVQKPIRLPSADPPNKASLAVSGWGQLSARGPMPNILQKATVYSMSNKECQSYLNANDRIQPTNICALNRPGIGVCPGDSGGPLAYNGQLVGVVSMGYPCALGIPDIYTRVTHYISFINEAAKRV